MLQNLINFAMDQCIPIFSSTASTLQLRREMFEQDIHFPAIYSVIYPSHTFWVNITQGSSFSISARIYAALQLILEASPELQEVISKIIVEFTD